MPEVKGFETRSRTATGEDVACVTLTGEVTYFETEGVPSVDVGGDDGEDGFELFAEKVSTWDIFWF